MSPGELSNLFRNGFGGWGPYCARTFRGVSLKGSMEAGSVKSGIEPDDLEIREFARRKVWAMTDPGTAERWDEDIASEVFIEYKLASARSDLEIRNWRGWVGSAVRSRLYAERRRERLRQTVHEKYALGAERSRADLEPIEVAQGHEAVTELDEAMRSLRSRRQKQILALSYFKGMTSSEIGDLLGMSAESVRGCKKRAIEKLRAAHHDHGFDEALMGVDIGMAATLALLQGSGSAGWASSTIAQASNTFQAAFGSVKHTIGRIVGSGAGHSGEPTAGVAGGAGGAAGTAVAIGGGKLVGAICAGVGSVCVAGALVTGVGPGLSARSDHATSMPTGLRRTAAAPVSALSAVPSSPDEDGDSGEGSARLSGKVRRSELTVPTKSQTSTVQPEASSSSSDGTVSTASPSQAADAFSPPVGGDQTSIRQSDAPTRSTVSKGSGGEASAAQAASAFGPLP